MTYDEEIEISDEVVKAKKVYVVDDDREVRRSLHFLLKSFDIVTWSFASAEDFLDNVFELEPAPIFVDLRMPGMNGLQVLGELASRGVGWPVVMITAHGDISTAVRSLKLGAVDFLEKPFATGALEQALDHSFCVLESRIAGALLREEARRLLDSLSPREREVVSILIEGASNKAAAYKLGLSIRTIEMHRKNALSKLGVRSIVEMSALFATGAPQR